MQCNFEKAALQESGAFLPLTWGFQAPTFRHLCSGPAALVCVCFSRGHRAVLQGVPFTRVQVRGRKGSVLHELGVDQPSHCQIGQVCELCSGAKV